MSQSMQSRSMRLLLTFAVSLSGVTLESTRAHAQNGQLIEGLFRTWVNSQTEKDRRKRMEAEARAEEAAAQRAIDSNRPATQRDPYEVQLPSGFGRPPIPQVTPPRNPPARTSPAIPRPGRPGPRDGRTGTINVRSREAAEYGQHLIQFNTSFDALVNELRNASRQNTSVRALMPNAYEVQATGGALFDQLDGLNRLSSIEASHRTLDRRYRQVSFQIRSVSGLSNNCRDLVRRCDLACSSMMKQMGMQPQFDRASLSTLLVTATTYMQALIDDMELSPISHSECRTLQHDCRLLRQRLVAANREIDEMSYSECVSRFSDFVIQWNDYSERVYAFDDPYLSRRLDRIGQCADQTYGLLWMPPPASMSQVSGIAHRIEHNLVTLSKSLSFFAMSELSPQNQSHLISTMRDLIKRATDLERRSQGNAARDELVSVFAALDQSWCGIQPLLGEIPSIRVGLIAETERGCEQLREIFGIRTQNATPIRFADLVGVGAALEGTSEYLHRSLEGYGRYMEPASYRKRVTDASRNLHRHSREVHELLSRTERLSDSRHLARLHEEAEHLLDAWNHLSSDLEGLESHGVTGSRGARIRRAQQELLPLVSQIGAALSHR